MLFPAKEGIATENAIYDPELDKAARPPTLAV
jgi:hypothetical protein